MKIMTNIMITIIMIKSILRMRILKDFILKMFHISHQLHAIITCIQITSHASKENQTIAKKVEQYQRKSNTSTHFDND